MSNDLILQDVRKIIETAQGLGLTPTNNVKIVRGVSHTVYIVSYTEPNEELPYVPANVIWINADPDSADYEKAKSNLGGIPNLWFDVTSYDQFNQAQPNVYQRYVQYAVGLKGDTMRGPLMARTLEEEEKYQDGEFVPYWFILDTIRFHTQSLGERVTTVEEELVKLREDLDSRTARHTHYQNFAALSWAVDHKFGKKPDFMQVFDEWGNVVHPENFLFDPNDLDFVLIMFSVPIKGRATFSK